MLDTVPGISDTGNAVAGAAAECVGVNVFVLVPDPVTVAVTCLAPSSVGRKDKVGVVVALLVAE